METPISVMTPQLLQDALLLQRDAVVAKVNAVLDGQIEELCIRTRYQKEMPAFIAACVAKRGELEEGVGERCLFVRDQDSWTQICTSSANKILIAHPELDFESRRNELLRLARMGHHAVIFSLSNPRLDIPEVIDLIEPSRHDVLELLKNHDYPSIDAERFAKRSNGNIYLLTQLISGTSERRPWATGDIGYQMRCLALIGGWDDGSEHDKDALSILIGQSYEGWVQKVYPLTRGEEPPILLEGKSFRPVSRWETWQQLGYYLTDVDLERFQTVATKVLSITDPELERPKEERTVISPRNRQPTFSVGFRRGIAETLALLSGQGKQLDCSATLPARTADNVVHTLLSNVDWKNWASLSDVMPTLAEAAPEQFLQAAEFALKYPSTSPLKDVFEANEDAFLGRNYHCGLLWAFEVLAWHPDYLNRVGVCLARMANYPLPRNMSNAPTSTLRGIFLTWLPQTLASIDQRCTAVERVIEENFDVGWQLLLSILPESHQMGRYNQKPVWRDWIDSNWKVGVTRSELTRQIRNYANLAVRCAIKDFDKLTELIAKWDHLPREVFQSVLDFLTSSEVINRPEAERFILWQTLADEVHKHRRFAHADWAMPEDELKRLEGVANAIAPTTPSVLYQRLFNRYDHDFYETDDYRAEEAKLANKRDQAILDVIAHGSIGDVIAMAKVVKQPLALGNTLGRVGDFQVDSLLLPGLLENTDSQTIDFIRGYLWARYFTESVQWFEQFNISHWSPQTQVTYFASLPFHSKVWRRAAMTLGNRVSEYWLGIRPNVFQANGELIEALQLALDYTRPDIAVACINALRHLRQSVPVELITKTLKEFAQNSGTVLRIDQHDLIEAIKQLQENDQTNEEDLAWIEFQFLKLLDRFSGGSPIHLERKLASDPNFFHEIITLCFRSEFEHDQPTDIEPQKRQLAEHVFRLIYEWKVPPGTTRNGTIDEILLVDWIDAAKRLCEESGHWSIAQQMIGHAFAYYPAGLSGMLENVCTAKVLDNIEFDDMRTGFRIALFNQRGVHGFTAGQEECEIAKNYREYANKYDAAKFTRIAAELRSLADGYERDAEREVKRNPFAD